MNRMLLIFVLLFNTISSYAQQGNKNISVLFIGNSYTYVNNLPDIVRQIGLSMGDSIFVDQSTFGGYTLQLHSGNSATIAKINQQPWDYVVVQEQSQLPSFSPAQVMTDVIPYALLLDSLIHANNACTKTVFYMTWGRKYGDASNCAFYPPVCTYASMQQRLKESYLLMADTCHAFVASVGEAFRSSIAIDSTLNLYQADDSHPSLEGSFLAASTIYSTITHKQIINQNYTAGLSVQLAASLQNIAWTTVVDSSLLWNLGINEPFAWFTYQMVNPNLLAQFNCPGNVNYQHLWYFGDTTTSTLAEPLHQYNYSYYFPVTHVVYDSCSYDSTTLIINATGSLGIKENPYSISQVAFDSKNDLLKITFNQSLHEKIKLQLFSTDGKLVLNKIALVEGNFLSVPLSRSLTGMHSISIAGLQNNFNSFHKILITR